MDSSIQSRVNIWLHGDFDKETKDAIIRMEKENPEELADAFYKDLEFGTGGLRGLMGVGTNRMNKYTVGMATQGFSNYLLKSFPGQTVSVAIGHDCRNNSRFFAETAAHVFAANGIKVYLFDDLRPTPELSFAIRALGCQGGLVCTASHNPKEYNGYKAYWSDGAQLTPPHDANVIKEVEAIKGPDDVKWNGQENNIMSIGADMDDKYIAMVKSLSIHPEVDKRQHDLKIVYTPIHGSGIKLVPKALAAFGFDNIHIVKEQEVPNGNFPTVVYPNPEESEAMTLGLKLAREIDADILLGTDPDADRVAVAIKDGHGNWQLLNGNQTAVLAFSYMIEARKDAGLSKPNDMIVKTIVTTEMIDTIARVNDLKCYNVLTGFKWIASLIRAKEGKENYIIGGEESFGLMIGDKVRDKDSISAVSLLCEMAAVEKDKGGSLYDKLIALYVQYGFYLEKLISIVKKGMHGQEEIANMMAEYRANPPQHINGSKVIKILDYQLGQGQNIQTGERWVLDLPKSNVLQFYTEDGSKISARPSGTEPKIKFYFSVHTTLSDRSAFDATKKILSDKIENIIHDLGLKD